NDHAVACCSPSRHTLSSVTFGPPLQPQQLADEIFTTLAGPVDFQLTQRVFQGAATVVNGGVKRLHLLIQSPGGGVSEGIALYHSRGTLPLELVTYNGGGLYSIAVLVYLAGKVRKVSAAAVFGIHKSTSTFGTPVPVHQLKLAVEHLEID